MNMGMNMIHYVVQRGDTVFIIARRFNVDLNDLKKANPQITNFDIIYPGQIIFIPGSPRRTRAKAFFMW